MNNVTVRMLLNMRSGLEEYDNNVVHRQTLE